MTSVVVALDEGEQPGALVARAASGDTDAFTRIVAAHHADMLRVAHMISGDPDLAADAAQAAWAIAWKRLGSLRDAARLRPWLMSIAANEARQLLRRQGRRRIREIAVDELPGAPVDGLLVARLDLAHALDRIDARDRAMLAMRFAVGLTSDEIGREIGLTGTAVRSRIARTLQRLREELDHD